MLGRAIISHTEWKIEFLKAILKHEKLDNLSIEDDDCCEFGKWLHSEAKDKYGKLASYSTCLNKHQAFHVEAKKVASAIYGQEYLEAERLLGSQSAFTIASNELVVAILNFKKDVGL